MSLDHALESLPNGLHDGELISLHVDYVRREATLRVHADVSAPTDTPEPAAPSYVTATIRFSEVTFVVIDPPEGSLPTGELPWIDAGDGDPRTAPIALPILPSGAFLSWIYVSDTNSFIRIAAGAVSLEPEPKPNTP